MQPSIRKLQKDQVPELLREIPSPPQQLYVRGALPTGMAVAVVGSRQGTRYGKDVTLRLAGELARAGLVIVSGLAYGIDSYAHQATVEAGGLTVAVMACGLDRIYPASHRQLAEQIVASGGALVTEYPEQTIPFKDHFVARNRLISGLARAILVIEAGIDSGTFHTARFALDQGKEVMVVPGNITSKMSAGTNELLKRGATPVTDSTDVVKALNFEGSLTSPVKADGPEEEHIFALLANGAQSTQELIDHSGMAASRFASIISLMEITGKVRNLGAGLWARR